MFLHDIPFSILRQLCMNLDVDKAWEALAAEIGYSFDHIRQFDLEYQRAHGSPTKQLLWDWATRNPTVKDLHDKLHNIGRIRERNLVAPLLVDLQGHAAQSNNEAEGNSTVNSNLDNLSVLNPSDLPRPSGRTKNRQPTEIESETSNNTDSSIDYNLQKSHKEKNTDASLGDYSKYYNDKLIPGQEENTMSSINDSIREPSLQHTEDADKGSSLKAGKEGPQEGSIKLSGHPTNETTAEESKNEVLNRAVEDSARQLATLAVSSDSDIDKEPSEIGSPEYTYKQLSCATNGFSDENKIGEGTFGAVYYGVHKGMPCAIKRLFQKLNQSQDSNDNASDHVSEIKMLMKFRHENIVNLYGYASDGDDMCLVYQYTINGSLEDRLQCKNGSQPLTWIQRLRIACGAANGLRYMHTMHTTPLIHGDLKSANILLDKFYEAKISDFGLAKYAKSGSTSGKLTHITRKDIGSNFYTSKAYMPPEVFANGGQLSLKADVYGFGIILYEMCTGERAYDEKREPNKYLNLYVMDAIEGIDVSEWAKHLRDSKGDHYINDMFTQMLELGNRCTGKKKSRPEMPEICNRIEAMVQMWVPLEKKPTLQITSSTSDVSRSSNSSPMSACVSHSSEGRDSPGLTAENQGSRGNPIDMSNGQQLPEAYKLQLLYDNKDKLSGDLELSEEFLKDKIAISSVNSSDNESLMAEPMKLLQETLNRAEQQEREAEIHKSDPKKLMAMEDFDKHKSDSNKLTAMEDFDKGSKTPEVDTPAGNNRSDLNKLAKMFGFDRASKMNETEYTVPEENQDGIQEQQEPQLKDTDDFSDKLPVNYENMSLSDNVDTKVPGTDYREIVVLENGQSEENTQINDCITTDVLESVQQIEHLPVVVDSYEYSDEKQSSFEKPDVKKKMANFFAIYENALTWTQPSADDEDDDDSDPDYVNIESTFNPDLEPFEFVNNGDDEYDSADTIVNHEGTEMEPCQTLCDSVSETVCDEALQPNAANQVLEGQEDSWPLQTDEVLLSA